MENKGFLTLEEAKKQAFWVKWYAKGVYRYKIKGEGCKLVEDGKVLFEGADFFKWYSKGVYRYKMKGKGWTLVEHGKVLVQGADWVGWYAKGVYDYKISVNKNK